MDLRLDHELDLRTYELSKPHAADNVRALVQRYCRSSRFEQVSASPRPVRSVGIVGAGMMGTAVAAIHVKQNLPVVITDVDRQMLDDARDRILAELIDEGPEPGEPEPDKSAGAMSAQDARRLVERLVHPTTEEALLGQCDLVIESISETIPAKRQLYARVEPLLRDGAILASNTSTIPVGRLVEGLAEPDRFCGLHFFHPVRRRPLVEIVCGRQTADVTIATAVAHAMAIDMVPIIVDDGPGFLVNRLLIPYLTEAMELLLEGVPIGAIEKAATDFGMAKGPLRLLDEIGLDTVLHAGWVLAEAFPERILSSPLLISMIKAGRLGCKSRAGFFSYKRDGIDSDTARSDAARSDKTVDRIIAQWAGPPRPHTSQSIVFRLLLPMILEATRMIEAGKIHGLGDLEPGDIDLGAVLGLGFPASAGGLLRWADTLSAARIVDLLQPLQRLGPRMQPTTLLQEMARLDGRFYQHQGPHWGIQRSRSINRTSEMLPNQAAESHPEPLPPM
ncbi:MAG: 3-hydroxyacyl-CoA dehydrogenase NAD-binding domain-containing protein [Thermoguttaceae bacterium]